MDFIFILDILGVIAFSISGVLTAMRKQLDVFGILIIAFATSVGGGTLRDVLIKADVAWLTNMSYVYVILITTIVAIIIRNKINYLRKSLFLFDTFGIGLYTVVGVEKGLSADLPPLICIAFGTISACFGGVIRDILCNDIPVIFHKEIYATACITGGFTYFLLNYFKLNQDLIFVISGFVVIAIRISAVVFNIRLPKVY